MTSGIAPQARSTKPPRWDRDRPSPRRQRASRPGRPNDITETDAKVHDGAVSWILTVLAHDTGIRTASLAARTPARPHARTPARGVERSCGLRDHRPIRPAPDPPSPCLSERKRGNAPNASRFRQRIYRLEPTIAWNPPQTLSNSVERCLMAAPAHLLPTLIAGCSV